MNLNIQFILYGFIKMQQSLANVERVVDLGKANEPKYPISCTWIH